MKLLFASPSRDLADSVALLLTRQGYEVDTVYDGVQALDRLNRQPYDCLVTQLDLPRLDGAGVLRYARGSVGVSIGILPVSTLDYADLCRQSAFDVLLPRPFAVQTLLDVLARLAEAEPTLCRDGLTIDYAAKEVRKGEAHARLTLPELDVMRLLAEKGTVTAVGVEQTLSAVGVDSSAFKVVRALNGKLRLAGIPVRVQTNKEGYTLV